MKIAWFVFIVLTLPLAQTMAADKTTSEESSVSAQNAIPSSSLENLMRKMWVQLRTLVPKRASDAVVMPTQVMGIRGKESTGSLLKPYWKSDRTQDPDFLKELEVYNAAQRQADDANFSGAISGFSNFIKTYPQSSLQANAQFGLGLAYGGAGAKQKSIVALNQFIKANPKHPLSADARQMVIVLKK